MSDRSVNVAEESVEDNLKKMPILTKRILRERFDALCSDRPRCQPFRNTSGGSTGEPAVFLQDREYQNWSFANKLLFFSWMGYNPGDAYVKIWGAPQDIFGGGGQLRKSMRAFALNELVLNCYQVDRNTWERYCNIIDHRKPVVIEAYADAMADFSRYVSETQCAVYKPRGVITSAGVLHASAKTDIQAAFGCPVLNRYGSREVGDLACSCTDGDALHVSELTHYIEILDDAGRPCSPGEEGDVVVTLLTNFSMPLIRYRIEDRAVWSAELCACGRTTRTLQSVTGRRSDYLLATDGTKINGTALTTLLYGVPGIQRYQYRQTEPLTVTVAVVPATGVSADDVRRHMQPSLKKLATLFGSDMRVNVEVTDDLIPTLTGKHRYIINDLIRT